MMKKSLIFGVSLVSCLLMLVILKNQSHMTTETKIELINQQLQAILKNQSEQNFDAGAALIYSIPRIGTFNLSLGFNDIESKSRMNIFDHSRVASITKTFNGAAILQLRKEGKLSLNDTFAQWVPEMSHFANAQIITIYQMLHHISGLPEYLNDALDVIQFRTHFLEKFSPIQLLQMVQNDPPQFYPGSAWSYCNTNFLVLGMIIERASQISFKAYIESQFTTKFNLPNTYIPESPLIEDPFLHGYITYNNSVMDLSIRDPSVFFGCGDAISTLEDLQKWAEVLYSGEALGKAENIYLFDFVPTGLEEQKNGYLGSSTGVMKLKGNLVGHGGDIFGYHSGMFYGLDDGIIITVFSPKDSVFIDVPMFFDIVRQYF